MAIIVGVVVSVVVVAGLIAVIVIIAIIYIRTRSNENTDTAAIGTNLGESSFSLDI